MCSSERVWRRDGKSCAGEDPLQVAESYSRGRGADAVLITASTESNEPVSQAAKSWEKGSHVGGVVDSTFLG